MTSELYAIIDRWRALDPELAEVAERRLGQGLGSSDTAAALGISARSVEHATRFARAWTRAPEGDLAAGCAADLRRLRDTFEAALDLDADQRASFARLLCADQPELARTVEALLAADEGGARQEARPAAEPSAVPAPEGAPDVPVHVVGGYRIVRAIGRSGRGTVYEALQVRPRRRVALEVLSLALATPAMRRRFEDESELMATLHHPGIAEVFEAGVHVESVGPERRELPWIAREYVEGARDLLSYAEERKLGLKRRLRLFDQVCRAVQYGHQRGVIHRDLKPQNLLVDAQGHARVIDFGLARATASGSTATLHTTADELAGTLRYMAPEALAPGGEPPDVRLDVYALGVVLYELLCGEPPHALDGLPLDEAARVVRERAPRPPSAGGVRGDLEVVLATALEKDPTRRYASVEALAGDLGRFLAREPILARRPSPARRLGLFVRRRPLLAGLAAALVLGLFGIAARATAHAAERDRAAREIARERDGAETARRTESEARARAEAAEGEARAQLELARREALQSNALSAYLEEMLASAHPARTGRDARVADLLDASAPAIDARFADSPAVRAALHRVAGSIYSGLGLFEEAARELAATRAILETTADRDDPETCAVDEALAFALAGLGRHEEAEELLWDAIGRRARVQGGAHRSVRAAEAQLATLLVGRGRYVEAEALFRGALAGLSSDAPEILSVKEGYAQLLLVLGRADEAEPLVREALAVHREHSGPRHPRTLRMLALLASLLAQRGAAGEAVVLDRELAEAQVALLGETHARTIATMHQLGDHLRQEGQLGEAEEWLARALDAHVEVYGEEHPDAPIFLDSLAAVHQDRGEHGAAEELYRRSLDVATRVLGAQHPRALMAAMKLAGVLWMQGRNAEALPVARAASSGIDETYSPEHPFPLAARSQLASILANLDQRDEAEEILWDVLARQTEALGEAHPDRLLTIGYLALLARGRGALEEAARLYREAYERQRARYGLEHPETLRSLDGLVRVAEERSALAEAAHLAEDLVRGRRAVLGEHHVETREASARVERIRARMEER